MNLRALAILQWTGLLGGAVTWAAAYVVGYGTTVAECGPAAGAFGIHNDVWQGSLLAAAATIVAGAELAAGIVYVRTRRVGKDDPPPDGRLHFFAAAGLVANVLFLSIVVLSGVASLLAIDCRGG